MFSPTKATCGGSFLIHGKHGLERKLMGTLGAKLHGGPTNSGARNKSMDIL